MCKEKWLYNHMLFYMWYLFSNHDKGTSSRGKDNTTQACYRDQPIACPVDAGGCLYGGKHPVWIYSFSSI